MFDHLADAAPSRSIDLNAKRNRIRAILLVTLANSREEPASPTEAK